MLNRKNVIIIAMLLVMALILSSCGVGKNKDKQEKEPKEEVSTTQENNKTEDVNLRETLLYYQNEGGYLVPVMRKIPWEEGIAKAALMKLVDTPEAQKDLMAMGLKAILPSEAQIRGLSIKDGLAKADFNKEAMECEDAISENNMVQGVVLTLCAFPSIDSVQFLFDGKIVKNLKHGTDISKPIKPQDINLEMDADAAENGAKVTVFFHSTSDSPFDYLVPVTRIMSSQKCTLESAIQELIQGPKDEKNLSMAIPSGTELLGVEIDEGTASINFSDEFKSIGEQPNTESMILKSIIMTAKQFPEVKEIKIEIDGKEYDNPISAPTFANEY